MRAAHDNALTIWQLSDGKPGHVRQSAGLIAALTEMIATTVHEIDVSTHRPTLLDFLRRRFDTMAPAPDLIVGAGRRCHWPLLAARRARGGRAVCLMRPVLPQSWFDLCLIPRHDRPRPDARTIVTDGVLNDVSAAAGGDRGLILVGGPSAHHHWQEAPLLDAIARVIAHTPQKRFTVTDSRRTPAATTRALRALARENVQFVAAADVSADWLRERYAEADTAWVTADSVSMIYESLSAGLAVGVFALPVKRADRITAILPDLVARNRVVQYEDWLGGRALERQPPLAEAARCAALILERFGLTSRSAAR